ncbi:MAG: tRNA (N(6)-L-threonylcarbamoyladenosine(37)-C(2))-methylthiotransferase MtaB [Hydrotalea sp.]|nr:tRNA (N(6)-L-threonylcarbamoyladenosine(37)-C(2))-methylthiotransferase MtaB [Hydrotalea sp.]
MTQNNSPTTIITPNVASPELIAPNIVSPNIVSPDVVSFGCRLNHHESAVLRQELAGQDVIVINSCAVTAEAERQVKQTIRKKHRDHPDKKIIVTGCAAQINGDDYKNMAGVDAVWGNGEKINAKQQLARLSNDKLQVSNIMTLRDMSPHLLSRDAQHARGFLEIQNGCDHRCTFCVIPFGRGNSRSHPTDHIIAAAEKMLANGFQEIVLTGVDIASWRGDNEKQKLPHLVAALLRALPQLPRLRLSSLDPAEIDDDLIALFATERRLLPHVHLSLQAGNDLILKRMKRRHRRADVFALAQKLLSANSSIVFGADIMAGFPTETDAMFADTADLVRSLPIVFGHVFPYSERPFTPAAKIKNKVAIATRKARAKTLRQICADNLRRWQADQYGKKQNLLIETIGSDRITGHNEQFGFVTIRQANQTTHTANQILPIEIIGADDNGLLATIIS